ncbi:MAG: DVU0772 family protein [Desulfotomaculaceae bacterium]
MNGKSFDLSRVEENIYWDVDLDCEFMRPRRTGYSFVIDLCDGIPRLALYRMQVNHSTSTTLDRQPPRGLLVQAVTSRGISMSADNIYPIDDKVRMWIEQNLLNATP